MVGLGGAFGAASRFGIAQFTRYISGGISFPLGTLIANVVGCFLFGILLGSGRGVTDKRLELVFGVGFLGALTTFSTFSAESIGQMTEGQWFGAVSNIVGNLVLGFAAVVAGIWIGRKWLA